MKKKLTQEKLGELLENGISEFAQAGPEKASMAAIAKKSGISVGVLYKYYRDKDAFFDACLEKTLDELRGALQEIESRDGRMLSGAQAAIEAVQRVARERGDYLRLYLKIAASSSGEYAKKLADEIEGVSADLYRARIGQAAKNGEVRDDLDPGLFAFFFDNLLMMLQFSYCSDYFRARMERFCGGAPDDGALTEQLLKFLESAFAFSSAAVAHHEGEEAAV